MRLRLQLLLLLSLGFIFGSNQAVWAGNDQETVESVEVQLKLADQIYEGLQERIEFSISRVGEQVLLSQPLSLLQTNKAGLKNTIKNVFSKVLVGFKLNDVNLELGKHSKIIVNLTPIAPLIEEIHLELKVNDFAPEMVDFFNETVVQMNQELNQIFVGLPVAAVSWSNSIFKLVIDYLVARELPGFQAQFVLNSGKITKIILELTPETPKVEKIKFNYQTRKIPTLFTRYKANGYREKFDLLKGLPISFLTHYRVEIEKYLTKKLNNFSDLNTWGITADFKIKPGKITYVELKTISNRLEMGLEARVFLGESQDNFHGNVQGFLGYSFDYYEVVARYYYGKNPRGNVFLMAMFHLTPIFSLGFEYEPLLENQGFCLHYQFEHGNYLSLTTGYNGAPTEAVIGFVLTNNFNLEFLTVDKRYGLQLMYHL